MTLKKHRSNAVTVRCHQRDHAHCMRRYYALSNDRETESLAARESYHSCRRKQPIHYCPKERRLIMLKQSSISMTFCKAVIDPAIFPNPNVF